GQKEEGDARIELAECLAAGGRFEEARQEGERAAAVHRSACGESSGELAEDYEKLGGICQKEGDFQAAVSYLEKALGIRDRQVGGDTTQLGLLLVALADLYTLIGRLAPALELLQQAVGKLGPARDANFADALEKLGAVYVRTGRYEDAADCYRQACEIWAASPEASADRLASDIRALEELRPWLPEPVLPSKPAMADPGTPVLLDRSPQAPAAGTAFVGVTGLGGSSAGALNPALAARGMAPPAPVGSPARPHVAPGPPAGAAMIPPGGAAYEADSAAVAPPVQTAGSKARPSVREALAALSETAASRRAGQAFWGWEELEFDSLRM
ncbi:MAG: tetratricopeptide repeat protein, partial [Bryobacteraceae bacterium]